MCHNKEHFVFVPEILLDVEAQALRNKAANQEPHR